VCSPEVDRPWVLKVDRDSSQGMRPRGFEEQAGREQRVDRPRIRRLGGWPRGSIRH
jgi:hypothetical protein